MKAPIQLSLVAVITALVGIGCGPSAEDLEVRDQRIAKLEMDNEAQAKDLAGCQDERVALNRMLEGMSADSAKSKERMTMLQQALEQAQAREQQQQARLEQFRAMLSQLKSMIDSGKLRVRIVRNRMVVELPEAVLFDSGKAVLKDEGKQVLAQLAPVLAGLEKREFEVAGHTDNVPIKTRQFPSNWELSTARAVNVAKLLIENGVAGDRISAAGHAETQPVASNDDDDGRKQNRRIEIVLVPSLDELPDL
ncbi:MAG: OmpA family protein, partial [Myxococcales bacterium]|nr:OmpA family protein [Myxococcales bacterium]